MDTEPKFERENGYWGEQLCYSDTYPTLLANSRANRIDMTTAEQALWSRIRSRQLGVRFRRQYIIGNYIADFACLERHLIIEVDGKYHLTEEQKRDDQIRTDYLNRLGFRVERFDNNDVTLDLDNVIKKIEQLIQ